MTLPLLLAIQRALDDFEAGRFDVAELQSRLEGNASALDSTYRELVAELRDVDADLELIIFGMLEEEQRPATISRLVQTRELLSEAMSRHEPHEH